MKSGGYNITAPHRQQLQEAKLLNLLAEHCTKAIKDTCFPIGITPNQVWSNLEAKYGPNNIILGESAVVTLSRQRWVVGDDPILFVTKLDAYIEDARYYQSPIRLERLLEIFPTLLPQEGELWRDFSNLLLNSVDMTWESLKAIFIKRANRANTMRETEPPPTSVFATSTSAPSAGSGQQTDPNTWPNNEYLLKLFMDLSVKYGMSICLKCRNFGHLTHQHRDGVKKGNRGNKQNSKSAPQNPPNGHSTAPSNDNAVNSVQISEDMLNSLLAPSNF